MTTWLELGVRVDAAMIEPQWPKDDRRTKLLSSGLSPKVDAKVPGKPPPAMNVD
ncbi:hypothetical protein Ptr902_03806 [Pyrenophora tritici-repentis]|nr:hypothetical protein Alg130_11469 [Pyrenophora tritici-repentis]KAI0604350.1 hypothetical protein TUN205_11402 [Pyrenophora tritici-repentis]KAI0616418.1 hypothetical protein TUN199_11590 [Pyrenophora tritici-repentis]KAI1670712.1 hypothetical protein L13192_06228 [Pyrenophora tritici-repentis]KAI2484866.1 hypothetical protein Ptr902_03806 [Pyrenophora tritici-repentis]